ncbi:hypothetical protein BAE44_0005784, partial [Dichanthelium oligosanthes]
LEEYHCFQCKLILKHYSLKLYLIPAYFPGRFTFFVVSPINYSSKTVKGNDICEKFIKIILYIFCRCYHLGNFKRFFCVIATEATDLQLCLVEPFLNEVSPDEMASLAFSESELETLCRICGVEIGTNEGMKAFVPKQTSFYLPTFMPQSYGIYISREAER